MDPDKRVALIVGAGDFIGAAIARRFAAGGFSVCLARRNGEKLEPVIDEIKAQGGDPEKLPPDSLLKPSSVAETYWMLHQQPRDAWTFELDLRPWMERW